MPHIELTNSDQVAIVDDLFYEDLLALGPWRLKNGYAVMSGTSKLGDCYLHRLVMEMFGHVLTGFTVDHRDRNKLNNRRRNLRPATARQQQLNRRQRNSTSGYVGVTWNRLKGKWCAYVKVRGQRKHVGYFDDPAEAARARDAAILAGPDAEFAVLNYPTASQSGAS